MINDYIKIQQFLYEEVKNIEKDSNYKVETTNERIVGDLHRQMEWIYCQLNDALIRTASGFDNTFAPRVKIYQKHASKLFNIDDDGVLVPMRDNISYRVARTTGATGIKSTMRMLYYTARQMIPEHETSYNNDTRIVKNVFHVLECTAEETMTLIEKKPSRTAFGPLEISGVKNGMEFSHKFGHDLCTLPLMNRNFDIKLDERVKYLLVLESHGAAAKVRDEILRKKRSDIIVLESGGFPDVSVRMTALEIIKLNRTVWGFNCNDRDRGGDMIRSTLQYGSEASLMCNKTLAIPHLFHLGIRAQWLCRKKGEPFPATKLNQGQITQIRERINSIRTSTHPNRIYDANELEQMVAEGLNVSLGGVEGAYILNRLDAIANEATKNNINLRAVPTDGQSYVDKIIWYDFMDSKCRWSGSDWLSNNYTLLNQVINGFARLVNVFAKSKISILSI